MFWNPNKRVHLKDPEQKPLREQLRTVWLWWLAPLTGFLALLWFLVRVVPKPSRAYYPCQRAAFPMATSFVIWVLGFIALAARVKRVRVVLKDRRFVAVALSVTVATGAVSIPVASMIAAAADSSWYVPSDPAFTPVGSPRGYYPGRVVWSYNPDATSWDGETGRWVDYIDQNEIDKMLSDVLMDLVDAENLAGAWDKLFKSFNADSGKGDVGYQPGENVVIKPNFNMSYAHEDTNLNKNRNLLSPQTVFSLLDQLINDAGVPAAHITVTDPSRYIPDYVYTYCTNAYPGIRFADLEGGDGREQAVQDLVNGKVVWSDDLQEPTEVNSGAPAYIPTCITEADYFINVAHLKGHNKAGVTACAKNHFGSFISHPVADGGINIKNIPKSAGVHPYITAHDSGDTVDNIWSFAMRPMGTYNALVDLMGHEHLGRKTLLFLIDGLYASKTQNGFLDASCMWQSEPFCNDGGWPSSLFASQDPVAIDSVALDFLRSEPTMQEDAGVMDAGDAIDNFLHEAALADNPPSGTFYDPEGDGVRMGSLGVHEHWNNATEKLYSGNFNSGAGIELIHSHVVMDVDADGMPDQWERLHYGGPTNAHPFALCANGINSVKDAYVAGLDPEDPASCFVISNLSDGIHWCGVSGRVYNVFWTASLTNEFQLLEARIPWTASPYIPTQYQHEVSGYYRLEVEFAP
ncbi:DUF362 domain-containing protein [Pontiellaceae bacterium B1224]|nr:DUF362 domain-containing protein [Pontiellaceae bacterium B1224]